MRAVIWEAAHWVQSRVPCFVPLEGPEIHPQEDVFTTFPLSTCIPARSFCFCIVGQLSMALPLHPIILPCSSYWDSCPQLHVNEPLVIPGLKSPYPWSKHFDSFSSTPFMSGGIFLNLAFELVYFVCFILLSSVRGLGGADTVGEGHMCLNNWAGIREGSMWRWLPPSVFTWLPRIELWSLDLCSKRLFLVSCLSGPCSSKPRDVCVVFVYSNAEFAFTAPPAPPPPPREGQDGLR